MNKSKQINEMSPTLVSSLLRDIKLSELLGHELKGDSKKVKKFIDSKLEGLIQFESIHLPSTIFYKKDNIVLFRQDLITKQLLCSYTNYWLFFINEIGLNSDEITGLTKALVSTHLNCEYFRIRSDIFIIGTAFSGTHLNCKYYSKEFTTNNN